MLLVFVVLVRGISRYYWKLRGITSDLLLFTILIIKVRYIFSSHKAFRGQNLCFRWLRDVLLESNVSSRGLLYVCCRLKGSKIVCLKVSGRRNHAVYTNIVALNWIIRGFPVFFFKVLVGLLRILLWNKVHYIVYVGS